MSDSRRIKDKYDGLGRYFDEAALRMWAAAEAKALGRGGINLVAHAIGVSRNTIYSGLDELASSAELPASRI